MTTCVRCRVTGRVQGVFFRASTQREAQALGITGYARNLHDGSVEVLVCGESQAVEVLCQWLEVGPAHAVVAAVQCETVAVVPPEQFTTG